MISDRIPADDREFLSRLPLLFVGTVDEADRPWASLLAGKPGFVRVTDETTLSVTARPVFGDSLKKSLVVGAGIGTLGIDFSRRERSRVNGKIVRVDDGGFEIRVDQSFGNCPQYIQDRELIALGDIAGVGRARPVRRGESLNRAEAALVARSDTFFIASHCSGTDSDWKHGIDVSHRGGKPGFVVVAHESELLFPDYTGNFIDTLGNILANPKCGLLFLDFETGDTLQITGEANILWDSHHTSRFPGAERVICFQIEETCRVDRALPFSWRFQSYSPALAEFDVSRDWVPAAAADGEMSLLAVNLSMPEEIVHEGKAVVTGIGKRPAESRVMLDRLNLEGDGQADLWGHGGTFRAVYVYSIENYEYWKGELGRDDFTHGLFGENFTVEGMLEDAVFIGDVYRIGEVVVEVSQPRVPCHKLAMRMGIVGFEKRFLKSGRVGFYCRVLEVGQVGRGDGIHLLSRDTGGLTVKEVVNLLYFETQDLAAARKALSIPALSHGWKGSFEERLAKADRKAGSNRGFRTMVVDRKIPESESITSFYLTLEDGEPLDGFEAGQFLTFELAIPGQSDKLVRTYSLSDCPNPGYYRVSIKRELAPADRPDVPPGAGSSYFHDQVEVGTRLSVGAARGKFRLDMDSERAVVLLSAGVGLTPLVSMMNRLAQLGSERPVWFVHGARSGREHAMGEHVRQVAEEKDNFHVHVSYSVPEPNDVVGRDYDSQGRVDVGLLKRILPFDDYDFYLCGPPPFMKSLNCGLLSMGVSQTRIQYEFFGPASVLSDSTGPCEGTAEEASEAEAEDIQVTFRRSGIEAAWDPECESILELAEKNGLSPNYSCRSGVCNTCMCEVIDGEVEYVDEPLSMPDPGQALICCSRPSGDLVIDV